MMRGLAEASIASPPSVGPTVRCSMISTGTGSAPPSIRIARSLASWIVKSAGDLGRAADDADAAGDAGSTWGEEMISSSRTMATRRWGSPWAGAGRLRGQLRQRAGPLPLKSTVTNQPVPWVGSLPALGAGDVVAVAPRPGRARGLALVSSGATRLPLASVGSARAWRPPRRPGGWSAARSCRSTSTAWRGSCTSGSSTMIRFSPAGSASARRRRARRRGRGAPRSPGRWTRRPPRPVSVAGLQRDLGAAPEVQTELRLRGERDRGGADQDDDGGKKSVKRGAWHSHMMSCADSSSKSTPRCGSGNRLAPGLTQCRETCRF